MSQVTFIFHNVLVRIVADGDVVYVESGDVGSIVSELYGGKPHTGHGWYICG